MHKWIMSLLFTVILGACNSQPTPVVSVVDDFDAKRYLGKWYEIVRMPHSFEEGLQNVTAEYLLNGDGTLEVTNRGFHTKAQEDIDYALAKAHEWGYDIDQMILVDHPARLRFSN